MEDTQVLLKGTSLLSLVKYPVYLTTLRAKEKEQTPKYQSKIVKGRKSLSPHFYAN